ncbi:MAG TPA: permease prefix domain 1-containing protein [Pyrinomonadaceae bacterium]|nr:permease prefix domain 1-containing protein [Pyrinomonadaceae bacterium]
MKALFKGLFHRFDREVIERQVEDELRFHLELLTEHHLEKNMPLPEAQDATLKRFGNVEQIKEHCVEISRNNRPIIRALKFLLVLLFLGGVSIRIFSPELHLTRVGDVLIMVAVLGRLFFYVRSLGPAHFASQPGTSSPLMLNDPTLSSISAYDQRRRTPLERVISDS